LHIYSCKNIVHIVHIRMMKGFLRDETTRSQWKKALEDNHRIEVILSHLYAVREAM
ncbi:hypothetical protein MKW92_021760, partial [Papaver armeniacum]